MSVLVTGATGFLGSYVAARLAERGEEVVALVRGADPQERLDAAVGAGRARALGGDLERATPRLPHDVTQVVHCAASISFSLPLREARAINLEGTRRLLDRAGRLPRLERFVHVSTAYVAGLHAGRFREANCDVGQSFRNAYERSKFEAELLVRDSLLPTRIVRPSIVVGESASGWTSAFNVLYFPLQAFARGLVDRFPADPDALVDVVPVDHVAEVVLAALDGDGGTLHAVAGDDAVTARELAALAAATLRRPEPVLDPAAPVAEALDVYFPYFGVRTRFDAARARALGLAPPPLEDYFARLVEYAERTRWGRRPAPTLLAG